MLHLAAVLGVSLPPMAVNQAFDGHSDLVAVTLGKQTGLVLILGKRFFETQGDAAFAFVIGRMLTRLRPEHLLTWPNLAFGPSELTAILGAACEVAGVPRALPADHKPMVQDYVQHFGLHLSPATVNTLGTEIRAVPHTQDVVSTWLRGVALTTNRAGFLMSKDLITSVGLATSERLLGNTLGQFEALRDLLCWSATDEFSAFLRYLAGPSEKSRHTSLV
jgi:hypothetical protein